MSDVRTGESIHHYLLWSEDPREGAQRKARTGRTPGGAGGAAASPSLPVDENSHRREAQNGNWNPPAAPLPHARPGGLAAEHPVPPPGGTRPPEEGKTLAWGALHSGILYDERSRRILAGLRDLEFHPAVGIPWLPWKLGGARPRYGQHRPHPGPRAWGWVAAGRYRSVSEYLYGNRLVSRSDFDPERSSLSWKAIECYHQDGLGVGGNHIPHPWVTTIPHPLSDAFRL